MIVMTTGLAGLMALMRQEERVSTPVVQRTPVRRSQAADIRKIGSGRG
nr:hypothetical protein [uncultured Brevundimonas sp.]